MQPFLHAFDGSFTATLRWHQLDALMDLVRADTTGRWYLYRLGEQPPTAPLDTDALVLALAEINALLRAEHQEDYCGIVYADNLQQPAFIKIYHPRRLGSVCGSSGKRTLPEWILSTLPPIDLLVPEPAPTHGWKIWNKFFHQQ
jgi:hypothetical protein